VEQAKQFLINGANKEKGTAAVHSNDPTFPYPKFNYLTYPEFLDLGIDLIIFSRKESVDNGSFKKLKILKPQTKRGFMSGNYKCVFATAPGFFEQHCVENYLTSCKVAYWWSKNNPTYKIKNLGFAREEFDLGFYSPGEKKTYKSINSFVHNLSSESTWVRQWDTAVQSIQADFNMWGALSKKGAVQGKENLRDKLRTTGFLWHPKYHDGYGHLIMNAMAMGIVPIVNYWQGYYEKENNIGPRTAGELMIDGETALFMDMGNIQNTIDKVNNNISKDRIDEMSFKLKQKFDTTVDGWRQDTKNTKIWLNDLV